VYVNLRIDVGENPIKLRTEITNATNEPQWFEEFLLTVTYRGFPLLIHAWAKLVTPNVSLGETQVNLQTVPDNVVREEWLKLEKVTSGEINLTLFFTPLMELPSDPEKYLYAKMNNYRLILERDHYFPGEILRGILVYRNNQERKIFIQMMINGKQTSHWIESYHNSQKLLNNRNSFIRQSVSKTTTTQWYAGENKILEMSQSLYDYAQQPDQIMPMGFYVFPFSFLIPLYAPPTCKFENGEVDYEMNFILHEDTFFGSITGEHLEIHQPFHVIEPSFQFMEESPIVVTSIKRSISSNTDIELILNTNTNVSFFWNNVASNN